MREFESTLVKNSVVRIKMYSRDSYPDHWERGMLYLCGNVYTIKKIYPRDRYGQSHIELNRMDTIFLDKESEGWWFYRDDFEKVNTNPKRKLKK